MALIFALSVFSIAIFGFTLSQDCSYRMRCGSLIDSVPECTTGDSKAVTCLIDHLSRCHRDKDAEKHLEKAKLQQLVICNNNDNFKAGFKADQDCWLSMDSCLLLIAAAESEFESANQEKKKTICKELKPKIAKCKIAPGVKDDCKTIRSDFIDTAFQELKCAGCATIAAQLSLLLAAIFVVALFHHGH